MNAQGLSSPAAVMARLEEIEQDLEERQREMELAALDWFRAKRDREKRHAEVFIAAEGTVAERKARADLHASVIGREDEAQYEALKAVCRVLETRANIGMALIKAHSRA